MQAVKGWKVLFRDRMQNRLEHLAIVGMGQEVTVQHHVDPHLRVVRIGEQLGGKGFLDDISGGHRIHENAAFLQIIPECLPCQFKGDLKSLDGTFFLQLGKSIYPTVADLAQQDEGTVKVVETLLPADVALHNILPSRFQMAICVQPSRQ